MNDTKYFFELYRNSSTSDWLFKVDTTTYDGRPNVFWIVHREYWKKVKCIDDHHIGKFLKNILPDGFDEIQESGFEYHLGSLQEGIDALISAGLQKI